MRRPPPPHRRGQPKTPGSGRRRGSLNRKTVELRGLMSELTGDVNYQEKFRRAFVTRRLHPSTEVKVWEYAIGRPAERVELSADLSMNQKLKEDRELFSGLDFTQLQEIADASEALMAKARAMATANTQKTRTLAGVSPSPAAGVDDVTTAEPTEQSTASTVSDQRDAAAADVAPPDTP